MSTNFSISPSNDIESCAYTTVLKTTRKLSQAINQFHGNHLPHNHHRHHQRATVRHLHKQYSSFVVVISFLIHFFNRFPLSFVSFGCVSFYSFVIWPNVCLYACAQCSHKKTIFFCSLNRHRRFIAEWNQWHLIAYNYTFFLAYFFFLLSFHFHISFSFFVCRLFHLWTFFLSLSFLGIIALIRLCNSHVHTKKFHLFFFFVRLSVFFVFVYIEHDGRSYCITFLNYLLVPLATAITVCVRLPTIGCEFSRSKNKILLEYGLFLKPLPYGVILAGRRNRLNAAENKSKAKNV